MDRSGSAQIRERVRRAMRPTLRWRFALVYSAASVSFAAVTLAMSLVLVRQATEAGSVRVDPRFVIPLGDGRFITVNEFQARLREAALQSLLGRGTLLVIVLGAIALGVAHTLAGRVLAPIRRISETARELGASRLSDRISLDGPDDELKDLADTFDEMLARLERSFLSQQRFVRDAGHELRTPTAVIRTELEVALSDPDPSAEHMRESAAVVLEAAKRIEAILDALLVVTTAHDTVAARRAAPASLVDLGEAVAAALTARQDEIVHRNLHVDATLGSSPVHGDAFLLQRMADEIVRNAIMHGLDRDGRMVVVTGKDGDGASLRVSNDGQLLHADEVSELFVPFRRAGAPRTARSGSGLGLAVVTAIADAHGGWASATGGPNGGLDVCVRLPMAEVPS